MRWYHYFSYFFGGAFLANALPHLGNGISGHAFQSPFASPPGVGLSSSVVNVVWGLFNLAIAYLLVCRVGSFDLRKTAHVLAFGAGMLSCRSMLPTISRGSTGACEPVHFGFLRSEPALTASKRSLDGEALAYNESVLSERLEFEPERDARLFAVGRQPRRPCSCCAEMIRKPSPTSAKLQTCAAAFSACLARSKSANKKT